MNIPDLQGYVSLIKDIALAITPIVTFVIALLGVRTYQKRQIWDAKLKMARRFMRLTRQYVANMRSLSQIANTPSGDQREKIFSEAAEALTTLQLLSWESEVLFNFSVWENVQPLFTCFHEYKIVNQQFHDEKLAKHLPQKWENVMDRYFDRDDSLKTDLDKTIAEFKRNLRSELNLRRRV